MSPIFSRWRSSLVVRVTGTIVIISILIISLLGTILYNRISTGIFDEKLHIAIADAQSTARSIQLQLQFAKYQDKATVKMVANEILAVPGATENNPAREVAHFAFPGVKSTLIASGTSNLMLDTSIPKSLRLETRKSPSTKWERTTILYADGRTQEAIAVGHQITVSNFGRYEFYVVYGLSQQSSTVALFARSLSLAGGLLIILIGLVTWFVLRRLIGPVRDAARIAEELTAGDLDQRMDVRGSDEVARLGYAFNEMAVALKQQISRLENLSMLQQRFVSDVSHELRTPLTTIRMASQVIYSSKDGFDPSTARSAELLISQIDRFESLLIDLLEVSRFDAAAAVMETDSIDLVSLVRESIDYVHPSQERIINLVAPADEIMVDVDKRRIQRILRNLITNAIDHREGQQIAVTIRVNETVVAIGVRDYGIGFSSKDRASLFDRFWRADPARARTRGGTGLGLSIAMEDAKLHQGTLEAWGQPKRGAHFVLTLPKFAGGVVDSHPISVVPRGEQLTEKEIGEL